ncbi:hypothetical protein CR513_14800, partial [Mucuna pruriens]
MQHWKIIKRAMRYLKRTKGYMLTYQKSESSEIFEYFDSNFVGCQDSKRFTFGYIYILAEGAISWKSIKQTPIASSTMAVEFVTCFEASKHGIWLQNFVTSLRIIIKSNVTKIWQSFTPTTIGVLQSRSSSTSRTSFMLVNPLTKGLIPKVFQEHTTHM